MCWLHFCLLFYHYAVLLADGAFLNKFIERRIWDAVSWVEFVPIGPETMGGMVEVTAAYWWAMEESAK